MKKLFPPFLRRRITPAAVICAALVLTAVVSAHRLGGKFYHVRSTWLYIPYTQAGAYGTPVYYATRSWYNTPTVVIPYRTYNYSTSKVDYYTVYRYDSWWGLTVHHPCSYWGCSYVWADLYLNSRTLAYETSFIRQKVAAHEFGHGLGLAHTPAYALYSSIMKQGYLSYNTPRSHDINDTNGIYPW